MAFAKAWRMRRLAAAATRRQQARCARALADRARLPADRRPYPRPQETYDSVLLDGAPRPSPYRKCWFKFQLDVSPTYPHDAPTVKLLTPTYHTHVASDGLKMCATYIPETWASVDAEKRSLYQLLVILRSFLAAPSGEHAVNSEASRQFQEDIDAFDAMARRKAGADDECDILNKYC